MFLKRSLLAGAAFTALVVAPFAAVAQESDSDERVVVTGSFIKRPSQGDLPSPTDVVGSEDIDAIGAESIADITRTLTINTGSENVSDAFTQNGTTGTTNINLRGLGLSSTLVLLNGQRQVSTAQGNNDGVQFVDTSSLIPNIAIERLEIVKDGASALYGSDAVAGVVNFITRTDFEGLQIEGDYQFLTGEGDQSVYNLAGIYGVQGERGHIVAALQYRNSTPLHTRERRFSRPQDDSSSLGLPGSYFGVPGIPAGAPVIDPTGCEGVGGIRNVIAPAAPGIDIGLCGFDFGDYYTLVPEQRSIQGYFHAGYEITDDIEWTTEFGYARNRTFRNNSPSFPNLTLPTVPATNPFNPFGAPVQFFGRAIGNGVNGSFEPPKVNEFESDTWRFSTSLTGDFLWNGTWRLSYTTAENDYLIRTEDLVAGRFQDALNGLGGPQCDPRTGTPGTGNCQFFNPFASALNGLAPPNSRELIDSMFGVAIRDANNELNVFEGLITFDVAEWDAGTIGAAMGIQYRDQQLTTVFDSVSQADQFAFLIGDQDFGGSQDVVALFGELAVPLHEMVDLQFALRYETYGGSIGSTVDPKVALLVRPNDQLSLRGSYSTSFRAPSVFQQVGQGTSLNQVVDPVTGGTFFAAVRAVGNPDLAPEESRAFNVGATWEPIENLTFNADYWNFSFNDLIVAESFQALINAFPTDTRASLLDPCTIETTRICRVGSLTAGPIVQVNNTFTNASSLDTSGIDFKAQYVHDSPFGTFVPFFEGTYILEYELDDPQAGLIAGAGSRNFNNIGTSAPELRFNTGFAWQLGMHSFNLFARYIDSYEDDQNAGREIDSILTLDMQYNMAFNELLDLNRDVRLTVGVINVTDELPPQVFTNLGFDSKVHDPRGRAVYGRFTIDF